MPKRIRHIPRKDILEALRKAVLWAESCSTRIPHPERSTMSWRYLEEAREVLRRARQ